MDSLSLLQLRNNQLRTHMQGEIFKQECYIRGKLHIPDSTISNAVRKQRRFARSEG